jgi:hypothetical protein
MLLYSLYKQIIRYKFWILLFLIIFIFYNTTDLGNRQNATAGLERGKQHIDTITVRAEHGNCWKYIVIFEMQRYKTQPDKISVVGGNVVYPLYPIFNRNIYEYTCYVPYGNDISVALDGMHEEMRVTQTQTPIEIKITSESRNKGLATQTHTYQIHTDWRTGSKSIFVPRRLL